MLLIVLKKKMKEGSGTRTWVGLFTEHAYARGLVQLTTNLGPVGCEIAAERIEKVLPPGAKFARGWIGNSEPTNIQFRPTPQFSLSSSSSSHLSAQAKPIGKLELVPDSNSNSEIGEWRGTSVKQNHGSVPPDLNVDFHSPASSVSGALADSKQP